MLALEVRDPSQVAEVRRVAVKQARDLGLGDEEGRVAIVVSELATNLLRHGGGGQLLLGAFSDPTAQGLQTIAIDQGRGMVDIGACLRDGFSTAGSAGQGLGAIQRQSNSFDIYSQPTSGTAVLSRIASGRPPAPAISPSTFPPWGGISVMKEGELVCGDAWQALRLDGVELVLVADGLGHGALAAHAANLAVALFQKNAGLPLVETLQRLHDGLRATRGAAVAIARLDAGRRVVDFAGIGNIAGSLIGSRGTKKMVSHNGTAGHLARKIHSFSYPMEEGWYLVVLHSDGIGGSWTMDRYPGLAQRHPALISAVLYRDFGRGRDDATVVTMAGRIK